MHSGNTGSAASAGVVGGDVAKAFQSLCVRVRQRRTAEPNVGARSAAASAHPCPAPVAPLQMACPCSSTVTEALSSRCSSSLAHARPMMPAPSTTKSDVVSEALQMSSVRRRLWGSELAGLQVSCWMREPGRCVHRPCAAGTAGDALRWLSARIAQCVCPVAACLRCAGHNGRFGV